MKKLLCVLAALCLMLTVALAEEAPALNWEDVAPALEAGGVAGEFRTFDEIAVMIWIPEGLNAVELSEEDVESGYVGYFMADDESAALSIVYVDANGMSLEEYAQALSETEGVAEIEAGTVNGLPCVTYTVPEQDTGNVAFATEAGYILEVTCWPQSEAGAEMVWGAVISSIQAAE